MGAEVLEEEEFEPMFTACENKISGKKLLCLDLMVGAMVNGCVIGKMCAITMELCLLVKVLFVMKHLMKTHLKNAESLVRHYFKFGNTLFIIEAADTVFVFAVSFVL